MKKLTILLTLLILMGTTYAQKSAYVIFDGNGKKVTYAKMLRILERQDVILFGELHNNPISHWLQYELTADLFKSRELVLGAEMFEADNQAQLDEYLNGKINYKVLDSTARLWPNTKTDYLPLVDFAKENKLDFVASNIPRRYARLVHRDGFETLDTLPNNEKEWIAPLPIPYDSELPTYKKILEMMGEHGSPKLVMAQAIKDATMGHFIAQNFKPNNLFIHYNGAFHSDYYEGILWYLYKYLGDKQYATITTVEQEDNRSLEEENYDKADFIICVDHNMTKTY